MMQDERTTQEAAARLDARLGELPLEVAPGRDLWADIGARAMSCDISKGDWSSSARWYLAIIMKSFMVPKTEREGIGAHCTVPSSGAIQR